MIMRNGYEAARPPEERSRLRPINVKLQAGIR